MKWIVVFLVLRILESLFFVVMNVILYVNFVAMWLVKNV